MNWVSMWVYLQLGMSADITLLNLFHAVLPHDNTEIDQKTLAVCNAGHHAMLPNGYSTGNCGRNMCSIVDHQPKTSQNHQSPKKGK